MKRYFLILGICSLFMACSTQQEQTENATQEASVVEPKEETQQDDQKQFGVAVNKTKAISMANMQDELNNHSENVLSDVTLKGKVVGVCQKKGCWMTIDKGDEKPMRVTFKDYGLFMPQSIVGKEVVIHGKADLKEISIDDQKHYAQDAGKSEEEIATITTPETKVSFEADGVEIL